MKKRKLGHSDLFISEIGLGCMSLGTDPKKATEIIETALDLDINYFDTADLYDFGENEKIIGQALKPLREKIILATKVGNKWNKDCDGWSWDASKQHIKEAVKKSLLRLQTDYIDLYQLHGGTMEDKHEETVEAFEELVQEGFIRYYGISSIRPNVIHSYLSKSNVTSVMMQYSLLDRRPEEWMSMLEEKNVSIIARGPVSKGILTERTIDKASASIKENGYLDYSYNDLVELLGQLKEAFSSRSLHEIALQFVLSHNSVGAVIPGASSAQQVLENCKAIQSPSLSKDELQLLKSITKSSIYTQHRE